MSILLGVLCSGAVIGLLVAAVTASPTLRRAEARAEVTGTAQVGQALHERPRLLRWVREHLDRRSAGVVLLLSLALVLFAVVVVLGLLLTQVQHHEGLARADSAIARWGTHHATGGSLTFVRWVTALGSTSVTATALILLGLLEARRLRQPDVLAFAATVIIGELAVANLVKLAVNRHRPNVMHLVAVSGPSFPSGHSTSAAAAWSAVALILGRSRGKGARKLLNGLAVFVAIAVAASRALLGVHWFTDVLAGLSLGWGWYLLVAIAFGGRRQRLGLPAVEAVQAAATPTRASGRDV